jgi:hypothetical protein
MIELKFILIDLFRKELNENEFAFVVKKAGLEEIIHALK